MLNQCLLIAYMIALPLLAKLNPVEGLVCDFNTYPDKGCPPRTGLVCSDLVGNCICEDNLTTNLTTINSTRTMNIVIAIFGVDHCMPLRQHGEPCYFTRQCPSFPFGVCHHDKVKGHGHRMTTHQEWEMFEKRLEGNCACVPSTFYSQHTTDCQLKKHLDEVCQHDTECQAVDKNAWCRPLTVQSHKFGECACRSKWNASSNSCADHLEAEEEEIISHGSKKEKEEKFMSVKELLTTQRPLVYVMTPIRKRCERNQYLSANGVCLEIEPNYSFFQMISFFWIVTVPLMVIMVAAIALMKQRIYVRKVVRTRLTDPRSPLAPPAASRGRRSFQLAVGRLGSLFTSGRGTGWLSTSLTSTPLGNNTSHVYSSVPPTEISLNTTRGSQGSKDLPPPYEEVIKMHDLSI